MYIASLLTLSLFLSSFHLICNFLTKYEKVLLFQSPYTPDVAPADFFVFPKQKSLLK
jgi:hypothetical protein